MKDNGITVDFIWTCKGKEGKNDGARNRLNSYIHSRKLYCRFLAFNVSLLNKIGIAVKNGHV
jgi:hypothetical protein